MIQTAISTPLGLPKEIGQFMNQFVPYFKLYITFLDNRDEAMGRLKELYKDQRFVNWHEVQEPCAGRSLRHFLERPTKRLQEYLGDLMKAYASFSDKECQSAKNLIQTAQNLKETLDRIAHNLKVSRGRKNLIALSNHYGLTGLQTNSRWVVLKTDAQSLFNHRWKDIEFVICNDMVFTAKGAGFMFGGLKWALSLKGLIVFDKLNTNQKETQELAEFVKKYNSDYCFYLRNWEVQSDTYVVSFQDAETRDACYSELLARVEEHQLSQRQCNPFGIEKRLRGKKTNSQEKAEYVQVEAQSASGSSTNLMAQQPPSRPARTKRGTQDSELKEAAGIPLPAGATPPYKRSAPSPQPKAAPPAVGRTPPRAPPKGDKRNSRTPPRPGKRASGGFSENLPFPIQPGGSGPSPRPKKPMTQPDPPSQPSWVKKSPVPPKKHEPQAVWQKKGSAPPPPRGGGAPPPSTKGKRPPPRSRGAPPPRSGAPPPFRQTPPPQPIAQEEEAAPKPPKKPGPMKPNFLKDLTNKKKVQLKKVEPRTLPKATKSQNDLAALIEASRRGYREIVGVSDSEGSDSEWD